ncbi:ribonuclease activity regulator RraA [Saccharopolyspora rhizosphaerae]|uniref:Putative 4-hydroxy-4-methyl-2-oxoglutarate aldolase n=1 Tax=Saccharopolyspora rhizosphaerae TaxID=2492662 RepID=A0A3R8NZJ4_9PSEU|nr:ribonuclease activity regulator RraA [Saccharopolyspora rhizosphaerae]RRO16254.1 ribonuclease activity regulator RraA [Saccharopolyspora rhizosphaerae]
MVDTAVTASDPLPEGTVRALRYASTATITTQLLSRGLRNQFMQGLRALNPDQTTMVGVAFTLRYIPAREDVDVLSVFQDYDHPQRKAVESVSPGEVLVIDSRGKQRAASLGHILATRLLHRGCAGVVTDGSVRDSDGFTSLEMPTFAVNPSANTNLIQHHAVDMQVPIGCCEVAVYPGDVLVGDADGVVCIPRHLVEEVAEAAAAQEHLEEFVLSRVESGLPLRGTYPPDETSRVAYQEWATENPWR